MKYSFFISNKEFKLNLESQGANHYFAGLKNKKYKISVEPINSDEMIINIDGKIYDVIVNTNKDSYSVYVGGHFFDVKKNTLSQVLAREDKGAKKKDIKTSMPGKIVKILVKQGDKVKKEQPVLVLEAMKMQNEIKSPKAGVVRSLTLKEGDSVEANALLFSVE
ncbi:MAG: biotin/lipoyl-containing protein [Candidatus Aminicenantaceae bacterium]